MYKRYTTIPVVSDLSHVSPFGEHGLLGQYLHVTLQTSLTVVVLVLSRYEPQCLFPPDLDTGLKI